MIYYDGNKMWVDNVYINVRAGLAYNLAKAGEYDEACEQLEILAEEMCAADSRPLGKYNYDGNRFLDTLNYEHTVLDAHREWLEDLLSQNVFNPIREKEAFKEVCKQCEELRSVEEI